MCPQNCGNAGGITDVGAVVFPSTPPEGQEGSLNLSLCWNKTNINNYFEIEWLIVGACQGFNDENNENKTTTNGYKWAKAMLHDKRLQGILGFSAMGWTGEDWIKFLGSASQKVIKLKLSEDVIATDPLKRIIGLNNTNELISDVQPWSLDKTNINLGDVLKIGNETRRIKRIMKNNFVWLSEPLTQNYPINTVVTLEGSITRAWRAWMRHKSALGTPLINDPDFIEAKEPAYYVYNQYLDTVLFYPEGISDDDGIQGNEIHYWESGWINDTAENRKKPQLKNVAEPERTATFTIQE